MKILLIFLILAALQPFTAAADAPKALPKFAVMEYRVEGNTVLPSLAIERALMPHMGETRTIEDVQQARKALENAYHDAGYLTVFVDLPEQKVGSGVVVLKVTEGSVERLRVTGSRYYALGEIKAAVPSLAEGQIPNFEDVQQEMAALARTPGRRVTPVLKPSRTPGKVEVDLKVADDLPLHADIELNDRYSPNTTHLRLAGNVGYDNLWQRAHKLSIGFQIAPEQIQDARVLSATYLMPLGRSAQALALYGVVSRSNMALAGDTTVLGNANIAGARWIVPLPVREEASKDNTFYHSLTFGVDYKDFKENILFGADRLQTPISYLPLSLAYTVGQLTPTANTSANLSANFSVRGVADETIECVPGDYQNEFACKRFGADANYFYLRGELSRLQKFGQDWALQAKLGAQVASGPLISSEQFTAGGVDTVRGYLESEALGDHGALLSIEGRRLVNWPVQGGLSGDLHAFVEGAFLRNTDVLSGTPSFYHLLSAGLGLRLNSRNGFYLGLELAQPLQSSTYTDSGDTRTHFRLGYDF